MLEGLSQLVSASKPSKTCLVIVGSVHGNEPAGRVAMEKVAELSTSGAWKIDGDVYGLIGNPRAVEKGERFVEENLNRAFGRAENPNSYEAKRAEEIAQWFKELAAEHSEMYLLDLHSVSMGETRIAIYNAENAKALEWCKKISPLPFFLGETEDVLPGTVITAFEKLGGV